MTDNEQAALRRFEEKEGKTFPEIQQKEVTMCFGCGRANPMGLHLHFFRIDHGVVAVFTPKEVHQSYNGRMHGGLTATLLDEVTGNYIFLTEVKPAYTAKMEIRYRKPALVGHVLRIEGRETRRKGPLVIMEGVMYDDGEDIVAETTSYLMIES